MGIKRYAENVLKVNGKVRYKKDDGKKYAEHATHEKGVTQITRLRKRSILDRFKTMTIRFMLRVKYERGVKLLRGFRSKRE